MPKLIANTPFAADRIPIERWRLCLAAAVVLSCCLLGGLELVLRWKGYEPSVRDDRRLWALNFEPAVRDQRSPLFIGSSRILCDLQLDEFEETYGEKPHQLGLVASSPLPILRYLANDANFRGKVICEVTPEFFYSDGIAETELPLGCLETHRKTQASLFGCAEKRGELFFPTRLVFLSSQIQIEDLVKTLVTSKWPKVTNHMRPDRNRATFKDGGTIAVYRERIPTESPPRPFSDFERRLVAQTARDVSRIRSKGGDVVFLQLPCAGSNLAREQAQYPRAPYWYGLLERTRCQGLRTDEDPELRQFRPVYDFSHLSVADARVFSRIVGLRMRELLKPDRGPD